MRSSCSFTDLGCGLPPLLEGFETRYTDGLTSIGSIFQLHLQGITPVPILGEFGDDQAGSNFLFINEDFLNLTSKDLAKDKIAWQRARQGNTSEDYDRYLKAFPTGQFRLEAFELKAALLKQRLLWEVALADAKSTPERRKKVIYSLKTLSRMAKKEARRLRKEKYYVPPGSLPMERRLEKSYARMGEQDPYGRPKYITAKASAIGGTKIVARQNAIEAAKLVIAGKIETNILALVEASIANQQFNQNTAIALTKILISNKQDISQKLGRVISLFEAYKEIDQGMESFVIVGYDRQKAMTIANETLKENLDENAEELLELLDQLLDY